MTAPAMFLGGRVALHAGDCLDVLRGMAEASVDSVVTDPPYHLTAIVKRFGAANAAGAKDYSGENPRATGAYARASRGFMGKTWDGGDIAFRVELWAEVWRVLKPGGHLAAFSATRTYHRMACAIEDAGFEIRDQLAWMYGTGFPKSLDVSKAIDKAAGAAREMVRVPPGAVKNPKAAGGGRDGGIGAARPFIAAAMERGYHLTEGGEPATEDAARWQGWGTALKPAFEPICLARKPLAERNVAANVRTHGTGAINIDACRVGDDVREAAFTSLAACSGTAFGAADTQAARRGTQGEPKIYVGRWPANVVHDGSDEVVAAFPDSAGQQAAATGAEPSTPSTNVYGARGRVASLPVRGDSGSAARFFFSAKAGRFDRLKSKHPTVKPVELMRWLVRLLTPPGGVVLDPFAGTGTTGAAAYLDGFSAVLIEREAEYRADIAARMRMVMAGPDELARALAEAAPHHDLPLFGSQS